MSELTEMLGIPVEAVERQLAAARGFGAVYTQRAEAEEDTGISLLLAASNYRTAGAHALLLMASQKARSHFQQAANLYGRARSPYGVLMSNLGFEAAAQPEEWPTGHEAVFALWGSRSLAEGFFFEQNEEIAPGMLAYRSKRVGVLGLEVGLLLELRRAALSWLHDGSIEAVITPLNVLVAYYAQALSRARENTYHWERLRMTFHPLEPDVLGLMVGLDRVLASADGSVSEVLPSVPQRREVLEILQLSLAQFQAWGPE